MTFADSLSTFAFVLFVLGVAGVFYAVLRYLDLLRRLLLGRFRRWRVQRELREASRRAVVRRFERRPIDPWLSNESSLADDLQSGLVAPLRSTSDHQLPTTNKRGVYGR